MILNSNTRNVHESKAKKTKTETEKTIHIFNSIQLLFSFIFIAVPVPSLVWVSVIHDEVLSGFFFFFKRFYHSERSVSVDIRRTTSFIASGLLNEMVFFRFFVPVFFFCRSTRFVALILINSVKEHWILNIMRMIGGGFVTFSIRFNCSGMSFVFCNWI